MYTLILIVAVTTATAVLQPCTDYCQSLLSGTNKVWRPDCVCSTDDNTNLKLMPRPKIKPASRPAEAAVYYEPAEHVPSEGISFVYHPFIILNPTFRRHTFSNNINPSIKMTSQIAEDIKEETKSRTKYKRRNTTINKLDFQPEGRPMYLDVSIQDSPKSRSSVNEFVGLSDLEVIERNLMDCIDLHTFVYLNKSNNITELKKVLSENKFKKYEKLSDSDIMTEIKSKCNQPSSIVKQSLLEIKTNSPKKSIVEYKSARSDVNSHRNLTVTEVPAEFKTMANNLATTDIFVTDNSSLEYSTTASQYIDKTVNNSLEKIMKTISTQSTPTNNSIDKTKRNQHELISAIYSNTPYSYEDTTTIPLNNIDSIQSPSQLQNIYLVNPNTIVTTTETKSSMSNSSVIDDREPIIPESSTYSYSENDVTMIDPSYINNPKYYLYSTSTTIQTVSENDIKTTTSYDLRDHKSNEGEEVSSTTTINENHILYPENELKIPKLTVKEYPNSTIMSEVSGNEVMPNNDFTHNMATDISYFSTTEENLSNYTTLVDYQTNVALSDIIGEINMDNRTVPYNFSQIVYKPPPEISGKIYFNFHNESIPVRFVQKPDGDISVGLDGISLCDELVRSGENKSALINVLCNCARSQDCSSRSTLN